MWLCPGWRFFFSPQLIIVACDQGQPAYETMQPLQVALDDIDDNEPIFLRPPVRHQDGRDGTRGCRDGDACERVMDLSITTAGNTMGFVCFLSCKVKKKRHLNAHNPPFFRGLWQRDSPQYQVLSVPEHSQPGTVVGNVTGAVDADEGSNAIVYYFIAGECRAGRGWAALHPPAHPSPTVSIAAVSSSLPFCPGQQARWRFRNAEPKGD